MSGYNIVDIHCEYKRKMYARVKIAREKAVQFAIRHRLIVLNDRNEVIRCFGGYWDRWDKPETYTIDSARTYVYMIYIGEN